MKYVVNENGVDREMTKAEQEAHMAWEAANIAEAEAKEAEALAKQAAKQAVLERLGITEEEAKLILG